MSQSGAAAAQMRPQHVTTHMQTLAMQQQSLLRSMEDAADQAIEGALICGGMHLGDKVAELRGELALLLATSNEVQGYAEALATLAGTYAPQLGAETDFDAALGELLQRTHGSFNPEASDKMKAFDEEATGEPASGSGDEMGEDEDLVVTGSNVVNNICPISGKNVMDLSDPVEDEKGYVYERAAIIAHMRGAGWCEAPTAGATHYVHANRLRPSARVLRLQRRRRLGLGGQAEQRGGQGGEAEVIDV